MFILSRNYFYFISLMLASFMYTGCDEEFANVLAKY